MKIPRIESDRFQADCLVDYLRMGKFMMISFGKSLPAKAIFAILFAIVATALLWTKAIVLPEVI